MEDKPIGILMLGTPFIDGWYLSDTEETLKPVMGEWRKKFPDNQFAFVYPEDSFYINNDMALNRQ